LTTTWNAVSAATSSAVAAAQQAWDDAQMLDQHQRGRRRRFRTGYSTISVSDAYQPVQTNELDEFGLEQSLRPSPYDEPLLKETEKRDGDSSADDRYDPTRQNADIGENFVFLKTMQWMPHRDGWGVVPNLDLFFAVRRNSQSTEPDSGALTTNGCCSFCWLGLLSLVTIQLLLSPWFLANDWKERGGDCDPLLHVMVVHLSICQD
jgi:hypothetical protein